MRLIVKRSGTPGDNSATTQRRLSAANDFASLHRRLYGSVFARTTAWGNVRASPGDEDYERLAFRGDDVRTPEEREQDDSDRYSACLSLLGDGSLRRQVLLACVVEQRSLYDLAKNDRERAARLEVELAAALDVIGDTDRVRAEMSRIRAARHGLPEKAPLAASNASRRAAA